MITNFIEILIYVNISKFNDNLLPIVLSTISPQLVVVDMLSVYYFLIFSSDLSKYSIIF